VRLTPNLLHVDGATLVSEARIADNLSAPTLPDFQQAVREGRLRPGAPETKHVLGKMFLASFFSGVSPPGFGAAV
jgi:hypothetical protein